MVCVYIYIYVRPHDFPLFIWKCVEGCVEIMPVQRMPVFFTSYNN